MLFRELTGYLARLERIASRTEMTRLLAQIVKNTSAREIAESMYLLQGELLPAYHGIELNIAEKTMIRVLAETYKRSPAEVTRRYQALGDLGDVAADLAQHRKDRGLGVKAVYDRLLAVARETGTGSQERKVRKLAGIFGGLDARSAKFVTRIPLGKLRLGFSDATLLDALSVAAVGDKSARPVIEGAYNVTADIGAVAHHLSERGLEGLRAVTPEPGVPIRASLADRGGSAHEVIAKLGPEVGVEPKLDGLRTQVHVWGKGRARRAALFSRNLENTTAMFPEIASAARSLPGSSVILDGEAIGYNPKTGIFSPFQETVQRKRKHDVSEFAAKIPVALFAFDALYLNGRSLLAKPFRERRSALERLLKGARGAMRLTEHRATDQPRVVEEELKKNIAAGLEGIVVKNLTSPYEAGKRGFHWVKIKAGSAALQGLRGGKRSQSQALDTIDCLVMGAYTGKGKRAVFGVGGFLLGVRVGADRYHSISRLGSGLSDEQFREAKRRIAEASVRERPSAYSVDKDFTPDIWVRPSIVVEVLADEITLSPRHTAGRDRQGRGYSLRFPRLVRFRDDKSPEETTTVREVAALYRAQRQATLTRKKHR